MQTPALETGTTKLLSKEIIITDLMGDLQNHFIAFQALQMPSCQQRQAMGTASSIKVTTNIILGSTGSWQLLQVRCLIPVPGRDTTGRMANDLLFVCVTHF